MSRYSHESFFFSQRKRFIAARVKKALDNRAVSTRKKSTVLKFKPQGIQEAADSIESESVVGYKPKAREGSATSQDSGTDQPSKHSLHLPLIGAKGQHLTASLQPVEEVEEDQTENDPGVSKHKLLSDLEKANKDQVVTTYKFSEVKFASTSILANLSKVFEEIACLDELSLPLNLVDIFGQDYYRLVADTVVEKRDWQTDCYLDLKQSQSFLTQGLEPDEEEEIKQNFQKSLNIFAIRQNRARSRLIRMNRPEEERRSIHKVVVEKKSERPSTARSIISVRSDIDSVDIDWDRESVLSRVSRADTEYDKLPSHLRLTGTPLLRYRRETTLPRSTLQGPMTRLEKFKAMANKQERKKKVRTKLTMAKKPVVTEKEEQPANQTAEGSASLTSKTNISFSLTSTKFAEKGWIIRPSMITDPESYTLNQWASNLLKETNRRRQEAQMTARLRGEDGPLIVRHYSDTQNKMQRSRHQRSCTFPLPIILSKLPPSLSSSTHATSAQEEFFVGEGLRLCMIVLPDGSGFCKYYSGHSAISFCRKGDGSRGLYTIVYDNTDAGRMIGYFLPNGCGCCYYRNGSIRTIMDLHGGKMLDRDGNVTKKWVWPPYNERMPVTVIVELNTQVVFQCVGRTSMALRFSCHGQVHKFPVGLVPEALEEKPEAFWMTTSGVISDKLQTGFMFKSKSARALEPEGETVSIKAVESFPPSKPQSREVGIKRQRSPQRPLSSVVSMDVLMDSESPSQPWDEQLYTRDLDMYKNKFKDTVDEWMDHYRKIVGISAPSRRHTPIPSATQLNLLSSHSLRSLSSSFSSSRPGTHSHSRSLTHPTMATPLDGRTRHVAEAEEVYPSVKPTSPLSAFIDRPKSHDSPRSLKVGPAQSHPQPPWQMKRGCPLSLHQILLDKSPKMAQCRCDKRRVPLLRDLEFDEFLKSQVPNEQLVVICITSSRVQEALPCEPLLNSIHYSRNRSRFSPCQQSSDDSFRILMYDLDRALDDLKLTVPLLVERHHVVLGMFLMFMKGQLIGANTEFNGYGVTKRDFLKQIQNSIDTGRKGHFLPQDFKLLPTKAGSRIYSRSLWAYPISGVLGDFISCTPSMTKQSSSSLPSSFTSLCSEGIHRPSFC